MSDLPFLDAARQRLGDPEAARRKRRSEAAVAAERARRADVIDSLLQNVVIDESEGALGMLHGQDLRDTLVDESALPGSEPDLLAGPFAHIVVDEAQELTDAEWQMPLLRCRWSFTIVGDRAQARHGFTESWRERLERIGLDRIESASLGINYRTPEEIMAGGRAGHPGRAPGTRQCADLHPQRRRSRVVHGSAADLARRHLARHDVRIACVIGDPSFRTTSRVRSLTPELSKGLEFDLVVLIDPEAFGEGVEERSTAMSR